MNLLDMHFNEINVQQMSRMEPLGQPLGVALLSCLKLSTASTDAPTALSDLPQSEMDEFNGLRDAQEGNICLIGQSEAYYRGFDFQYKSEQGNYDD